jgi:hypothetical protein
VRLKQQASRQPSSGAEIDEDRRANDPSALSRQSTEVLLS